MFSMPLARTSRPQARPRSIPLVSWRDVAINQPQVQHTSAGAPSKAIGSAGKRDGGASGRQIGRLIPGTTATAKPTSEPRYLGRPRAERRRAPGKRRSGPLFPAGAALRRT